MTKFLLLALGLLGIVSCAENIDTFNPDPVVPIEKAFSASVFVEVVDPDGTPLEGVTVNLGTEQVISNEFGVARFVDADMYSSTYVTVESAGYFHGSRRFYPTPGKTHFVRIMMLPDNVKGSFDAGSGGSVNTGNGVTLNFPADGIADADGNAYAGSVNVAMQPILADDPDLSYKMPGDLTGEDAEGNLGALASLGMVAVELRGSSGQLLNVKEGSTVEMRMEVPSGLVASAPSSIPMWYFDEEKGLWIEEGTGSLQGNEYVANLPHFSFWNCDAWFPLVKWGATFVYSDGSPASQILVCLTILSMESTACGFTNEEGLVCGKVAKDEEMLLQVKDPCGNVIYSEVVGPYSDTTVIGPITLDPVSITTTTVSGCVVNCFDEPVENGYAVINSGGTWNIYAPYDDNGCFEKSFMNCNESDVTVFALDEDAIKQSLPQTYDYAEEINTGTLQACEDIIEYVELSVEGVSDPFVWLLPQAFVQPAYTQIYVADSTTNGSFFFLGIPGDDVGTYTDCSYEIGVPVSTSPNVFAYATEVTVVITYFGEVGDYIQGTLSGILEEENQGPEHNFTGEFSVLRN